jgi:hypothetical protein
VYHTSQAILLSPMILKDDRSWQPGQKTKVAPNYRVKNWAAYDIALRERGDITVWFDEEDGHRKFTGSRILPSTQ